jgi:hypothetical protein
MGFVIGLYRSESTAYSFFLANSNLGSLFNVFENYEGLLFIGLYPRLLPNPLDGESALMLYLVWLRICVAPRFKGDDPTVFKLCMPGIIASTYGPLLLKLCRSSLFILFSSLVMVPYLFFCKSKSFI